MTSCFCLPVLKSRQARDPCVEVVSIQGLPRRVPESTVPVGHARAVGPDIPRADVATGVLGGLSDDAFVSDFPARACSELPQRRSCMQRLKATLRKRQGKPNEDYAALPANAAGRGTATVASEWGTFILRTAAAVTVSTTTAATTMTKPGPVASAPAPPLSGSTEPVVSAAARLSEGVGAGREQGGAGGPSSFVRRSKPVEDRDSARTPAYPPARGSARSSAHDSSHVSSRSAGLLALLQAQGTELTTSAACAADGRESRTSSRGAEARASGSRIFGGVSTASVVGDDDDTTGEVQGSSSIVQDAPPPLRASSAVLGPCFSIASASAALSYTTPPVSPPADPIPGPADDALAVPLAMDASLPAGPVPRVSSSRAALRRAARMLQQQTSLQRSQAAAAASHAAATAQLPIAAPVREQGQEQGLTPERGAQARQDDWQQVKAPVAVRAGGGVRIVRLAQSGRSPAATSTGKAVAGGAAGASTAAAAAAANLVPQNCLGRQHTPLMLRRLRITASGSTSGSFGQLDFLDAAACTLGAATTPTPSRPRDATTPGAAGSQARLAYRATPAGFEPAMPVAQGVLPPSESAAGQGRERSGDGVRPGRHARFTGGAAGSPRTTARALLERQQTPCPLRWAPRWWEESGDALTEEAGRFWVAVAPAIDAVEGKPVMGRQPAGRLAVRDGEDEREDADDEDENCVGDVELAHADEEVDQLLCTGSGTQASSRGNVPSRAGQAQSRLCSPAPQPYVAFPAPAHAPPHPHPRSLRVQLSLSKLRRPSATSVVSLVAGPEGGELSSTGGSFTVALRTSYGGSRHGAAGGGGGGGTVTPTRRGRRRNLAGNENMLWDHWLPTRFSIPGVGAAPGQAVPRRDPVPPPVDEGAEDIGCRPACSRLPGPHGCRHAPVALAAPQPPQYHPQPSPLQLQELADSLGQLQLQAALPRQAGAEELTGSSTLLGPEPKPSPLGGPLPLDHDPIRAVWSRASSACSSSAFRTDATPITDAQTPLPGHQQLHRGFPQAPERAADGGENEHGSLAGSIAISPIVRQGSGISRLAYPQHRAVVAADCTFAGGRATQSSDGSAGATLLSRWTAAGGAAGIGGMRAALGGRCLGMGLLRPASVSDVAALALPGGDAGAAGASGRAAQQGRRVLHHTGSVRSHAPTEDDSAESLAKLGSEYGCGQDKGTDFGMLTDYTLLKMGWDPRLPEPVGGPQADGPREGPMVESDSAPARKDLPSAGASVDLPRRLVVSGRQQRSVRAEQGALWVTEGDSPKAATVVAAGGYSPLGCPGTSEHIKGLAALGPGGSSRLSRCT